MADGKSSPPLFGADSDSDKDDGEELFASAVQVIITINLSLFTSNGPITVLSFLVASTLLSTQTLIHAR